MDKVIDVIGWLAEWGSEDMVDFLSLWAAKAVPR
jgi:hypothetical protein